MGPSYSRTIRSEHVLRERRAKRDNTRRRSETDLKRDESILPLRSGQPQKAVNI
jgi:hypothetical protein